MLRWPSQDNQAKPRLAENAKIKALMAKALPSMPRALSGTENWARMKEQGMVDLPKAARAVVIGGGVSGCSVAYHLAKAGWTDVVLLERRKLTSGTTWHAAGLIGQLRGSANMTRLAKYSADLYRGLEAETGVATGMKQVGSISVALTRERHEELLRQATVARIYDVEVHEISPAEAKANYPHLNIDGVVGAVAWANRLMRSWSTVIQSLVASCWPTLSRSDSRVAKWTVWCVIGRSNR